MRKLLVLIALMASLAAATAAGASAQYGRGAVYQVELSMNIPGKQGGGIWLWFALNQDGTGDYAGSDCGHGGQGAASDKGDVTWTRVGDQIVISGVTYNGIPTNPMIGDFAPFAAHHHRAGCLRPLHRSRRHLHHPAGVDPSGVGFTRLQAAP